MFIEINDISTGTVKQEPLNAYSINYVFSKQVGSKYNLIYVLTNGLRKVEEFNSQSALNDRIDEIKEISGGGGGGTNVYTYKGSCTFENLPSSGQIVGDVWNITNDFTLGGKPYPAGTNVAWDGTAWDALAGSSTSAITVELGEAAGMEVMQELLMTGEAFVSIDANTYPNAYASLDAVFNSANLGTKNINVSISNMVVGNILIPVESNSASPSMAAGISGVMPFGEYRLFNIQIRPFTANDVRYYNVNLWVEDFNLKPLPVRNYDGTTINTNDNSLTMSLIRNTNYTEHPGVVRMSEFTVYDDDAETFIEMGSGLLLFNTFPKASPSDPVDPETMTATFYGDRRNAIQASFELLIEEDEETHYQRLGIQNYRTYNNVIYYDGTLSNLDTATLDYIGYYVVLNDGKAHKTDTGLFTVYDSDLEDYRELGTGTLIFKYDSNEDNFVCTFYGEGSQSNFLLALETDSVTGNTILVMSDYSSISDTIGDINEVLSTLTTPSAVEQALSEI